MENDLQRPLKIFWFYYLLLLVNTTPKIDYQFITAFFLIYIIFISRIFSRSKSVGDVAKNWMYLFYDFLKQFCHFLKKCKHWKMNIFIILDVYLKAFELQRLAIFHFHCENKLFWTLEMQFCCWSGEFWEKSKRFVNFFWNMLYFYIYLNIIHWL